MTNLTFIQANSSVGTGLSSQTVAYPLATTTHSYLMAWMWTNTDTVASVTDSLGNTWAQISLVNNGFGAAIQLFQVPQNALGGGANTVTVNYTSGTSTFAQIIIAEYTGQYTAGAVLDAVNPTVSNNSGDTTMLGANPVTTDFTNETILFFAIMAGGTTITGTGGYVNEFEDSFKSLLLVDGPATALGSYAPTGTVSPAGGVFGVTYSIRSSSSFPPVVLTSVSPGNGTQNTTETVTVNGSGFGTAGTISFSGTGITVNSYSTQTDSQIVASITIATAAALGARDVTVTNTQNSLTGTLSGAFTVNAPSLHYSVPDCRDYGNFPNNFVTVNGTKTYTVPNPDSRAAGAPVDSRVSDPAASGMYPQNSRTLGVFGPGE